MKIFSGSANQKLGEKIAKILGTRLCHPEKFVFPDGEERVRILQKVLDQEVVVVEPLSPPVNENFVELLLIVDALRRNGAKKVTAVIPYLGYQRQDRMFRRGEAVSLLVVIKALEAVGVSRVITFDLHSIKIPEFFKIPVSHLSAVPLFAEKIKEMGLSGAILVAPDMGAVRRIKQLSEKLEGMPFTAIEKSRDLATGAVVSERINKLSSVKSFKNKTAIIVDDMISGGGTIVKAVELLKNEGFEKIFVFATHAVFSQNAPALLREIPVERVFVTDTIFVPREKRFSKLEILSVAQIIAENL